SLSIGPSRLIQPCTVVPCGALTVTVSVVEPLAGTVTLAGTVIRLSPGVIVPAFQIRGTVLPKVFGMNLAFETANVRPLLVGLCSVMLTEVGRPTVTRPKLAEAGSIHVVAFAATERFSRPAPCAVGPTSCNPVAASLTTKSARFTSADLICAGVQSLCSCKSTAAEPAICGVDIEVPLRKAHGASPQSTGSVLTQELRTLTPTEVKSGLTAKSTLVGPWPLKP